MIKFCKNKKIIVLVVIPLLLVFQYYLFKLGWISPMIKGVDIKIIQGEYIQDIDKYVVKLGDSVVLSPGDYIKIPKYAKDPKIKFIILDDSKTIDLEDNSNNEKNTVILKSLKSGYTSVGIMKNSRVLKKVTILVVDPTIEDLNVSLEGDLKYVGDSAKFSSYVEVDYKEFNNSYDVTYESSNEKVLKVNGSKIEAVGVGSSTIYAKSKDKVEAIRFNIVARVKGIEIEKNYNIDVGQSIKLNPKIITSPKNLKPPKIMYKFSEKKLPVERAVSFDENGNVIGIREGSEKITISCGTGNNKKIEVITINVKKDKLENNIIKNLISQHNISDNNLNIVLSWDIIDDVTNYDIYIKNNLDSNGKFELYESITQESFIDSGNRFIMKIPIDENIEKVDYEIYIIGRNEEGSTKPSNIISIKAEINKEIEEDTNEEEANEEN